MISLVGVVVAVVAAAVAAWQAWEARKARTESSDSAKSAEESAKIAAAAQTKLAEIEEGRAAQQRRMLDVEWHGGDMYLVTNRTGETVTAVTVEGSGDDPALVVDGGSWDEILDQSSETFFARSGTLTASWTDARTQRQKRVHQIRRGDK